MSLSAPKANAKSSADMWWVHNDENSTAVVALLAKPGRFAMLFFSPPDAPGVDSAALSKLLTFAGTHGIKDGSAIIQAMARPGVEQEKSILSKSGFRHLAELISMQLDLNRHRTSECERPELKWLRYGDYSEQQLAGVIEATYENSMDCPGLRGLRDIRDVIATHKSSGRFTPSLWWVVEHRRRPAGCILLNKATLRGELDVVYMGVAPEFRGLSLGKAMISRAISHAANKNYKKITLAVDSSNIFAKNIYESIGFLPISVMNAHIMAAKHTFQQGKVD